MIDPDADAVLEAFLRDFTTRADILLAWLRDPDKAANQQSQAYYHVAAIGVCLEHLAKGATPMTGAVADEIGQLRVAVDSMRRVGR